jgi:hypothetical protein
VGSISRYNHLERFKKAFGEKIKEHYEQLLIGKTIVDMSELSFNYWKSADVTLSDGQIFTVHFGWSTEQEEYEGKEQLEDGDLSAREYFDKYLKGKEITQVHVGYERDDEIYAYAFVDEEHAIEIPIGYDPESDELHDFSIITESEFMEYLNNQSV